MKLWRDGGFASFPGITSRATAPTAAIPVRVTSASHWFGQGNTAEALHRLVSVLG